MNRSFDVIKSIYKPFKLTKVGKVTILETMEGNYVLKENNSSIRDLYDYLESRNFDSFPKIVDSSREGIVLFEYINDIDYPKEQRAEDLIKTVANLHLKTSYFKDVTEDNFKKIYDDILSNVLYLEESYERYFDLFFQEEYLSPSHNLFMQNYSKIMGNLKFCHDKLDDWYDSIKEIKRIRVSVIHNNLMLEHYLKNDKDYLISWDKSSVDTPVLDLANFYKNEYFDLNFDNLLKNYFSIFNFSKEEKDLFFILIALPKEIIFSYDEFKNCIEIREILDYIFKTENLIRPYYSKNKIEKDSNLN